MNVVSSDAQAKASTTYLFLCFFILIFQLEYLTFAATQKLIDMFRVTFVDLKFPNTTATIKKDTGFTSLTKDMTVHATCPKCYSIYLFETSAGLHKPEPPKFCSFVDSFKNAACQTAMYKNNSKEPMKKFVYHCLISSIQRLYMREGFEEKCEEWRLYSPAVHPTDTMYHCSQGKMWRSIRSPSGEPFVNTSRSLCLTLNAG